VSEDHYYSGFYAGMTDEPGKIVKSLSAQYEKWKGIFVIAESNPFMIKFDLYIKES
jgi:hypothetical protein